jgi:hypothetical protein
LFNGTYYFDAWVCNVLGVCNSSTIRNVSINFVQLFLGSCFDNIKNQDETDKDYGGICGRCGNYTFYSDDTAFQILDQANLIDRSKPFNQSLCETGKANLGAINFFLVLIVIGIFIFGFLIIFLLVPFVIFVVSGKYKFFLWDYFKKSE